jgi:hypothetical protein
MRRLRVLSIEISDDLAFGDGGIANAHIRRHVRLRRI